MTENPEIEDFQRRIRALARQRVLRPLLRAGTIRLQDLSLEQVKDLVGTDPGYYFLIAAAGLNRTSLKEAVKEPEATIVKKPLRKAFAIRKRLPVDGQFDEIIHTAVALRRSDLSRRSRGGIEALFRERLRAEGIPILMSPPVRQVPGLLIGKRKPDGVYPDPASGRAPKVYLEIKNVRRVSDDIQKRLYEIAEASLEMKFLYGALKLSGLALTSTREVLKSAEGLRAKLRKQIRAVRPTVVLLVLCPRAEGERYRGAAEAFVDRVFFQEEIDACLEFLKSVATG